MGISIKNQDVERDIRALADATGASVTDAVGRAVREALQRHGREAHSDREMRLRQIDDIIEEVKTLAVFDHRPIREIRDEISEEGL